MLCNDDTVVVAELGQGNLDLGCSCRLHTFHGGLDCSLLGRGCFSLGLVQLLVQLVQRMLVSLASVLQFCCHLAEPGIHCRRLG